MASIVVISDGKPGHENQSLGLAEAIQRQSAQPHDVSIVAAMPWWRLCGWLLLQGLHRNIKADLVIAAGHRTHLSLLVWGWLCQAKTVVLMKPSLPLSWFDLCLMPEHDQPLVSDTVIATKGALNRVQVSEKKMQSGLLLIGGPSRHVRWDNSSVLAQIEVVLRRFPDIHWELTTSRRTPEDFLTELIDKQWPVKITPVEATDRDWLPMQLAQAQYCWVTSDSISMIYEAMTAGCRVGLLLLAAVEESRLSAGVKQLIADGWVSTPTDASMSARPALAEADRCASEILQRGWL